jgi:hypothetical protein
MNSILYQLTGHFLNSVKGLISYMFKIPKAAHPTF